MRAGIAAAMFALCALGTSGATAQQQPGWSYAYIDGTATASEIDEDGNVIATLECRPPEGDIILTDYSFRNNRVRRADRADVRIGVMSVNVPAEVERARGRGRRYAVVVRLPQRPPILAAIQPSDQLSISVAGETRTFHRGGPTKMEEVAYACWQ